MPFTFTIILYVYQLIYNKEDKKKRKINFCRHIYSFSDFYLIGYLNALLIHYYGLITPHSLLIDRRICTSNWLAYYTWMITHPCYINSTEHHSLNYYDIITLPHYWSNCVCLIKFKNYPYINSVLRTFLSWYNCIRINILWKSMYKDIKT